MFAPGTADQFNRSALPEYRFCRQRCRRQQAAASSKGKNAPAGPSSHGDLAQPAQLCLLARFWRVASSFAIAVFCASTMQGD